MRSLRIAAAALSLAAPLAAQTTRPERTAYRETSRYADVMAFVDSLPRSPRLHRSSMGYTLEGRTLPLMVWGAVADASPGAVRASGRTVVYVQGNIHAGEVEGKEALQELLRSLVRGEHAEWADSLVLLINPIYNADGNERINLSARSHQYGPVGGMGQRPNAQGLDLNRDHTKLDAPETRSLLEMIRAYDPHVLVDLHTTNGTYHAYHLTYAPPLHPNTDTAISGILKQEWLPSVVNAMREKHGRDLHDYGNVPNPESTWAAAEGSERGWYTFDHRPRFSNNYAGLRNRFGILSEAYAYLPFDERIAVTREFVEEVLTWAHAHSAQIRHATQEADRRALAGTTLAVSARLHRGSEPIQVLMGAVDTLRHPYTGELMMRRRDVRRPEQMADYSTFEPAESETMPEAWLVPAHLTEVIERLEAHGIQINRMARHAELNVEEFRIDSTKTSARPFQNHNERSVWGGYSRVRLTIPAGTIRVEANQPLGRLAFALLEPRSDDGLLNWNSLDSALTRNSRRYPILRVPSGSRTAAVRRTRPTESVASVSRPIE